MKKLCPVHCGLTGQFQYTMLLDFQRSVLNHVVYIKQVFLKVFKGLALRWVFRVIVKITHIKSAIHFVGILQFHGDIVAEKGCRN